MRAEELMSREVKSISPEARAVDAFEAMQLHHIHHLVVRDDQTKKVVGVISDRDLGGARGVSLRRDRSVRDLMTASAVSITPKTTLREAANQLRGRSIGCLPVVDGKTLVGVLTITDVLEYVGRGGGAELQPPKERAIRRINPGRNRHRLQTQRGVH